MLSLNMNKMGGSQNIRSHRWYLNPALTLQTPRPILEKAPHSKVHSEAKLSPLHKCKKERCLSGEDAAE